MIFVEKVIGLKFTWTNIKLFTLVKSPTNVNYVVKPTPERNLSSLIGKNFMLKLIPIHAHFATKHLDSGQNSGPTNWIAYILNKWIKNLFLFSSLFRSPWGRATAAQTWRLIWPICTRRPGWKISAPFSLWPTPRWSDQILSHCISYKFYQM